MVKNFNLKKVDVFIHFKRHNRDTTSAARSTTETASTSAGTPKRGFPSAYARTGTNLLRTAFRAQVNEFNQKI